MRTFQTLNPCPCSLSHLLQAFIFSKTSQSLAEGCPEPGIWFLLCVVPRWMTLAITVLSSFHLPRPLDSTSSKKLLPREKWGSDHHRRAGRGPCTGSPCSPRRPKVAFSGDKGQLTGRQRDSGAPLVDAARSWRDTAGGLSNRSTIPALALHPPRHRRRGLSRARCAPGFAPQGKRTRDRPFQPGPPRLEPAPSRKAAMASSGLRYLSAVGACVPAPSSRRPGSALGRPGQGAR